MDHGAILTFRSPGSDAARVEALPAPVLELVYAHHYLQARMASVPADLRLAWALELERSAPEELAALRAAWPQGCHDGLLFLLVCELGYARDADPERLLADFGALPGRMQARLAARGAAPKSPQPESPQSESSEPEPPDSTDVPESGAPAVPAEPAESRAPDDATYDATDDATDDVDDAPDPRKRLAQERLAAGLQALREGDRAARLAGSLERLWRALEPRWQREGRTAVDAACDAFMAEFARQGDVLEALPPHHFTRFERAAKQIRTSQSRGRLLVTPLFFAADGGFDLALADTHYIGFGIQSERVFAQTAARVGAVASRAKAFADPTRLMLLALIARYGDFTLTVGDLALQLGVSQPTVSGHLRLLREAELVTVRKKGNRSYYHLDADAVRALLAQLEGTLLS